MTCEIVAYSKLRLIIVAGEADEECIYEPVSLWNFLRFRQAERTGEPQHYLDCRVCFTEAPC